MKTSIAISIDLICCILSVWISYYLRLGSLIPLRNLGSNILFISISLFFAVAISSGLYKSILRFSGLYTLVNISKLIGVYGIIYSFIIVLIGVDKVPRTIGLIQPLLLLTFISFWRLTIKNILGKGNENKSIQAITSSKALVYGSGKAGRQLVRAMQESSEIQIKAFLDDDEKKNGCFIEGKPVYLPKELKRLIIDKKINLILLAIPSVSKKRRLEIIKNLMQYKIAVRTVPGISDLAEGKSTITDFNELEIDDLLGRIEVEPYKDLMKKNISLKTILVTGAGGSIGSELCRQIIKLNPNRILLLEISEYALYSIHEELEQINSKEIEIVPLIGSVQDYKRMKEILSIWQPETIYHAAAYKHVPIVEYNLIEGLKNNVFGTFELAKLSLKYGIDDFVFVSTDKAVRPTNIMGATKRLAELILQALNHSKQSINNDLKTKFSIVRFGNVLDSSGSVIPKFREQIRKGGPITLTHKDVTRYFMTITEAAQLVIQAGAIAEGGDVFVLDMGNPIKIYDLAINMIELSGLNLKNSFNKKGDIEIIITGLRPGEKLYEELLLSNSPTSTLHPKIYKSHEPFIEINKLNIEIDQIYEYINNNDLEKILEKLKKLIAGFAPNKKILDYTFNKK